jgi:hypothetical protein
MKKLLFAFAAAGILALASCSKDYTCECSNGSSFPIENAKKSDAKDACKAYETTLNFTGAGVSCDLK